MLIFTAILAIGLVSKGLKVGPWVPSSFAEQDSAIKNGDGNGSTPRRWAGWFWIGRGG